MSNESRAFTPEEVRDKLLDHICHTIQYWDEVTDNKQDAMEGLAFSILSALDGSSMALPAFLVTPMAHEDDKAYHQEKGENWFPENQPDLGMLHEHFHAARKRHAGEKDEQ